MKIFILGHAIQGLYTGKKMKQVTQLTRTRSSKQNRDIFWKLHKLISFILITLKDETQKLTSIYMTLFIS